MSVGDFVMTGGEIAAMAVIDAVSRLLPGVLGDENSVQNESFSKRSGGILEGAGLHSSGGVPGASCAGGFAYWQSP